MLPYRLGDAFRNSPARNLPQHIYFVLCEESSAQGEIVLVNFTTDKGFGCPPFVVTRTEYVALTEPESMLAFADMRFATVTQCQSCEKGGVFRPVGVRVPLLLVRRIQHAALECSETPRKFKDHLRQCGAT